MQMAEIGKQITMAGRSKISAEFDEKCVFQRFLFGIGELFFNELHINRQRNICSIPETKLQLCEMSTT
jgi:hypothetical protein